jgi:hypothetical protein
MSFLSKMAKPLTFAQIALALTVPAWAGGRPYDREAFEACAKQVGQQRNEGVSRTSFVYGVRQQPPLVRYEYDTETFMSDYVDVFDISHDSLAREIYPRSSTSVPSGHYTADQMTNEERDMMAALRVCWQRVSTKFGVVGPK